MSLRDLIVFLGAGVLLYAAQRRSGKRHPREWIGLTPPNQELGRVGNAIATGIANAIFAGIKVWKRLRR